MKPCKWQLCKYKSVHRVLFLCTAGIQPGTFSTTCLCSMAVPHVKVGGRGPRRSRRPTNSGQVVPSVAIAPSRTVQTALDPIGNASGIISSYPGRVPTIVGVPSSPSRLRRLPRRAESQMHGLFTQPIGIWSCTTT